MKYADNLFFNLNKKKVSKETEMLRNYIKENEKD